MWLMPLGEVIFGGVGSRLYGMLLLAIVTVFLAGLMVGRAPEYLGKFECRYALLQHHTRAGHALCPPLGFVASTGDCRGFDTEAVHPNEQRHPGRHVGRCSSGS